MLPVSVIETAAYLQALGLCARANAYDLYTSQRTVTAFSLMVREVL